MKPGGGSMLGRAGKLIMEERDMGHEESLLKEPRQCWRSFEASHRVVQPEHEPEGFLF